MKIVSMNINILTEEKAKTLLEKFGSFDLILLQETRGKNKAIDIEGFSRYSNNGTYAGVCTYVKKGIICKVQNLINERTQVISFDDCDHTRKTPEFVLINNYHPKINTTSMKDRSRYDLEFQEKISSLGDVPLVVLGDFNSVHVLHDCARNLSIKEEIRHDLGWTPEKQINKHNGCYEKHFMRWLLNKCKLKDNGIGKGFTFYKNDKECMRIDYCLTRNVEIKSYQLEKLSISDHACMLIEL
jgi:exonuclease III